MQSIRRAFIPIVVVPILLGLASCGSTGPEQALFGGGAGAVGAAVVGGPVLAGAVVVAAGNIAYCQINPERCN